MPRISMKTVEERQMELFLEDSDTLNALETWARLGYSDRELTDKLKANFLGLFDVAYDQLRYEEPEGLDGEVA